MGNAIKSIGNDGVVRHAPDDKRYHAPDERQQASGLTADFVTVPRSKRDGGPAAFNAQVSGVVHVDPLAKDGGVLVDLAALRASSVDRAVAESEYPHEVYYRLAAAGSRAQITDNNEKMARSNPLMPEAYVAPASDSSGRQIDRAAVPTLTAETSMASQPRLPQQLPGVVQPLSQPQPLVQQPATQQSVMAQPAPAPPFPWPYAGYQQVQPQFVPPPLDPSLQHTLERLAGGIEALIGRESARDRAAALPPLSPRRALSAVVTPRDDEEDLPVTRKRHVQAEEPDEELEAEEPTPEPVNGASGLLQRPRGLRAAKAAKAAPSKPRDGVLAGFETLKMPFVDGPFPSKAKQEVLFDLGRAGRHSARYHDVIEGANCVVLVYDTRYEEGSQYIPAFLGTKPINLHVVSTKQDFLVNSLDISFTEGCLDFVVLIKATSDAEQSPVDEEDEE